MNSLWKLYISNSRNSSLDVSFVYEANDSDVYISRGPLFDFEQQKGTSSQPVDPRQYQVPVLGLELCIRGSESSRHFELLQYSSTT